MREFVFLLCVGFWVVVGVSAWRATEAVDDRVWAAAVLLLAAVPAIVATGWAIAAIVNAAGEWRAANHPPTPPAARAPRRLTQAIYYVTPDERQLAPPDQWQLDQVDWELVDGTVDSQEDGS